MKQTIHIRRTQSLTLQLEVPQALSKETLQSLVNERLEGTADIGAFGKTIGASVSDWSIVKATPQCDCGPHQAPSRQKRSKK